MLAYIADNPSEGWEVQVSTVGCTSPSAHGSCCMLYLYSSGMTAPSLPADVGVAGLGGFVVDAGLGASHGCGRPCACCKPRPLKLPWLLLEPKLALCCSFWQPLQGELETKTKFWGNTAEVLLYGTEALRLAKFGEEYRWVGAILLYLWCWGCRWQRMLQRLVLANACSHMEKRHHNQALLAHGPTGGTVAPSACTTSFLATTGPKCTARSRSPTGPQVRAGLGWKAG